MILCYPVIFIIILTEILLKNKQIIILAIVIQSYLTTL